MGGETQKKENLFNRKLRECNLHINEPSYFILQTVEEFKTHTMFSLAMCKMCPKFSGVKDGSFYHYVHGFCGSGIQNKAQQGQLLSAPQCPGAQLGRLVHQQVCLLPVNACFLESHFGLSIEPLYTASPCDCSVFSLHGGCFPKPSVPRKVKSKLSLFMLWPWKPACIAFASHEFP